MTRSKESKGRIVEDAEAGASTCTEGSQFQSQSHKENEVLEQFLPAIVTMQ